MFNRSTPKGFQDTAPMFFICQRSSLKYKGTNILVRELGIFDYLRDGQRNFFPFFIIISPLCYTCKRRTSEPQKIMQMSDIVI